MAGGVVPTRAEQHNKSWLLSFHPFFYLILNFILFYFILLTFRIEPMTHYTSGKCSNPELHPQFCY